MSFLDSGGGGGKTNPTGSGPTGDSTGLGMDPTMSGFGDPSMFPGSMGWPGSGSTGGTTTGGTGASNVDATNYGVAQSQAPAPGTTATSIGGVRSDPISDADLQQVVNSLQGRNLQAQATPLEAAAQQGMGPPTTSPGQPTPDEAQAITGPAGAYGGGPTGTATALPETTGPNAAALQQQQAGGAERYPEVGAREQQQRIEEGKQAGTAGLAQRYPSAADVTQGQQEAAGQAQRFPPTGPEQQQTATAEDPDKPPPDFSPKTTPPAVPPGTKDQVTTGTPPATPGAAGGGQMNPLGNLFRGLLDVITGNFGDLAQMAKESQPGYDWRSDPGKPGDPWYGKPMQQGQYDPLRQPQQGGQPPQRGQQPPQAAGPGQQGEQPTAPAAMPPGSQARNSLPGAPDADPNAPDDGLKAQRQEWYKTHDRSDPFPEPQGPTRPDPETGKGQWGNLGGTQANTTAQQAANAAATGQSSGDIPHNVLASAQEIAKQGSPAAVQRWMQQHGYRVDDNWCGDFVNAVMKNAGLPSVTGYPTASNWRNWGTHTDNPQPGDVAVDTLSYKGGHAPVAIGNAGSHVTLVESVDPDGTIHTIGGNQGAKIRGTIRPGEGYGRRGAFEFRTMAGEAPQALPVGQNRPPANVPGGARVSDAGMQAIRQSEAGTTAEVTAPAKWDGNQYTNGYGTRAQYPGEVISPQVAEQRLQQEVGQHYDTVVRAFPNAPQNVKDALTSFTYNVGSGWMTPGARNYDPQLLQAVQSGDYNRAAQLLQRHNTASGRVLPGLTARRQREGQMMMQGGGQQAPQSQQPPTARPPRTRGYDILRGYPTMGSTDNQSLGLG